MKKHNPIYYLLFILLIMGAFASMAQNSYGLKIMGGVAFAFGLVFIIEFVSVLRKEEKADVFTLVEIACLFSLSIIFGLRVFYIRFPYIELIFGITSILLALLYLRKMTFRFRELQPKNAFLAMFVLVFHLSIVLFLFSLAMVPFVPKIAEPTAAAALVLLLSFIVAAFFKRDLLADGEKGSAFRMVTHFKDHSIIIVSLFLLFSFYFGFNKTGVLPGVYSDEFPRAYFEQVEKAISKKEKPVNGKYKYEEFMERYQEFLEHNNIENQ